MTATVLWGLAVLLIVVGVAGAVMPALPGVPLVFAGIVLAAWIDDFARIGGWTLALLGMLALAASAVDYLAAALGARRAGASGLAIAGAAIGTVLGVFTGLVGLLFLPLAGAALGEYLARRDMLRAGTVGVATWLGLLVGTVAKLAIVGLMLGVFVAALWL